MIQLALSLKKPLVKDLILQRLYPSSEEDVTYSSDHESLEASKEPRRIDATSDNEEDDLDVRWSLVFLYKKVKFLYR